MENIKLIYIIIQLTPQWDFSVTDYVKYYAHVTYLGQIIYLYNSQYIIFLTAFILTHPANLPSGRKPERPEKTHDFRQSVDGHFWHESVTRIELTNF